MTTTNAEFLIRDQRHLIHALHSPSVHATGHVWVKGDGAVLTDADGKEYIDGLKTRSPEVWIGGERVADVTSHPALRPSMGQIAHLLDMQHDPVHAEALTYISPTTGDRVGASFMPAADRAGLGPARRRTLHWHVRRHHERPDLRRAAQHAPPSSHGGITAQL